MASEIEDLRRALWASEEGSSKLAKLNTELRTAKRASDEAIEKLTVENAELHAVRQALESKVIGGSTKPPPP
ncbi:hypothetical protein GUJ93_ZPchr0004g40253 [Zizania palustris]|uniref:Uncharacterized protein n=1 Tax=Zizania palustris TaxID=103762 RepID=A0A8J5VYG5_ZIZPA|nr:hypothetical protein GUJ93_ZPchr0004g40253 [Zizania palustris]